MYEQSKPKRPAGRSRGFLRFDDERATLIALFLSTGGLFSLGFGLSNLLYFRLPAMGAVNLLFFIAFTAVLADLRVYGNILRAAWLTVIGFGALALIFFALVGGANSGAVWLVWFPHIAMFLLGTRGGLTAFAVFYASTVALVLTHVHQWQAVASTEALSNIFGALAAFGMIAYYQERAKERSHRKVTKLANSDPLTGVANRRSFVEAVAAAAEQARPRALLLIDLDHFKSVNDLYGHVVGDAALREVCRRLESAVRRDDLVGRLGGEEFGVLLLECNPDEARELAERIRAQIAGAPLRGGKNEIDVSVSIGVATTGTTPVDFERLFAEADRRLYLAKDLGRNRVVAEG